MIEKHRTSVFCYWWYCFWWYLFCNSIPPASEEPSVAVFGTCLRSDSNGKLCVPRNISEYRTERAHFGLPCRGVFYPLDFVAAGVTCTVFCRAMPQYFWTLKKGNLAYFLGWFLFKYSFLRSHCFKARRFLNVHSFREYLKLRERLP